MVTHDWCINYVQRAVFGTLNVMLDLSFFNVSHCIRVNLQRVILNEIAFLTAKKAF